MNKKIKSYVFYIGVIIFVCGLLLKFIIPVSNETIRGLPFVLSGFGTGIIFVGIVGMYREKLLKNDPTKAKQFEIDENDERNISLREKAGYATWYISLLSLAGIILVFITLDNKLACGLTFGVLLIHIFGFQIMMHIYKKKI